MCNASGREGIKRGGMSLFLKCFLRGKGTQEETGTLFGVGNGKQVAMGQNPIRTLREHPNPH